MFQFAFRPNRVAALATIVVGMAVAVSSFGIVRAEHGNPNSSKTYDCSYGTACVEGNGTGSATDGVYGSSTGNYHPGVYGTSNWAGVTGYTSSTNGGSGVSGVSTNSKGEATGVFGESLNGYGVYGTSAVADGVEGVTNGGSAGVAGVSDGDGVGVGAESNDSSGDYQALEALGDTGNTSLFYALNFQGKNYCVISDEAYLYCSGGVSSPVIRTQHRDSNGQHVLAYAAETASATIEDVGTARLFGGVANVQIDPAFASVMDHQWYYVFLTPLGDTHGLYVSTKTPSSFQVREAERGRSSLAFNYRIVAHPLGAKNDRLPLAPDLRRPPEPLRSEP